MKDETSIQLPESGDSVKRLEERNALHEARLNPVGKLPKVMIIDRAGKLKDRGVRSSYIEHFITLTDLEGFGIGRMKLNVPTEAALKIIGTCSTVQNVEIEQESRSKGYGRAFYLEVLKTQPLGVGLKSDDTLTEDSIKIWRWLEDSGVARHMGTDESLTPDVNGIYHSPNFRTLTNPILKP